MIYNERVMDLFENRFDYTLVHCISADFGMGKGIVVEFNKRYDLKNKITKDYPDYINSEPRLCKTCGNEIEPERGHNAMYCLKCSKIRESERKTINMTIAGEDMSKAFGYGSDEVAVVVLTRILERKLDEFILADFKKVKGEE